MVCFLRKRKTASRPSKATIPNPGISVVVAVAVGATVGTAVRTSIGLTGAASIGGTFEVTRESWPTVTVYSPASGFEV